MISLTNRSSILHPLTLIGLALWLSALAMLAGSVTTVGVASCLSIALAISFGGVGWKAAGTAFLRLLPLMAMIMLIQVFFGKGGDKTTLWGLSLPVNGLRMGTLLCLRIITILFSAKMLARLSYTDFDLAFRRLRLPEEITFMVFHATRIIPEAAERFQHLCLLMTIRGMDLGKLGIRRRISVYSLTALSVLGAFISVSTRQAIALELRGFRSKGRTSRLRKRALGVYDAVSGMAILLISMILGFA